MPTQRIKHRDADPVTEYRYRRGRFTPPVRFIKFNKESHFYYVGSLSDEHPCTHCKTISYSPLTVTEFSDGEKRFVEHWTDSQAAVRCLSHMSDVYFRSYAHKLSFQKDDSFQLLAFIAELDDTLAIATREFWRSLSYGSFNWGILPLVSDLESIYNTYLSLMSNEFARVLDTLDGQPFSRRFFIGVDSEYGTIHPAHFGTNNGHHWEFTGFAYHYGHIRAHIIRDRLTTLRIILDELGVHPDLRTVWDLMPLSFLVDYFLPVGDLLESLHPRGWFSPEVTFTGRVTFTGTLKVEYRRNGRASYFESTPATFSAYSRQYKTFTSGTRVPFEVEYAAPSYREWFNTAYVARLRLPRSRRLS